jgi:IS5 family transposase
MKPQRPDQDDLFLFQAHFDQLLNPAHPLLKLAAQIDWDSFDAAMADCYCKDNGAPAKATRLMVGLHYLKHTFNESDESVVARWVENPYWQYFCGYTHMQHTCPIHPTSLTKWRQRVGSEKLVGLLKQTVAVAVKQKHLPKRELKQVNVDTTVQEKHITHPTDSKLLYKAIVKLGRAANERGITLRQSYVRVGKRASIKAGRYAHAKQFKRMHRELRKLRTYVGRIMRDIRRKTGVIDEPLKTLLARCAQLIDQKPGDKNKLYSLHEPQVRCISKGKAHKRYEFGQKVALATTNRYDWFVGALLVENNPYDGHTLSRTLQQVEQVTGMTPSDAYVDKGYRGHDYQGDATIHLAGSRSKRLTETQRRRRKRRSAIEPKIGHAKSENRLGRCYLKGLSGDAMNVILAAAGANLSKLLRLLPCALRAWWRQVLQQARVVIRSSTTSVQEAFILDQPAARYL